MSTICPDRPAVTKLEGTIKSASPRKGGGQSLTVVDSDNREFYVVTNGDTIHTTDCQPEPGRLICVELGYLSTNRRGGGGRILIEARVVTTK